MKTRWRAENWVYTSKSPFVLSSETQLQARAVLDADQPAARSEAAESDEEPQVSLRTTGKS